MSFNPCPDCNESIPGPSDVSRRGFLKTAVATAAVATTVGSLPKIVMADDTATKPTSENLVKTLFDSLTPEQKSELCFDWNYQDDRGLLRTHVSNNWSITDTAMNVGGKFFTKDQQGLIEALFWGMYNPDWHDRIRKQLQDDAGGYGKAQTIALFGTPGSDKFEFVMTGRHLTIRCDGNTTEHVAFGGPIFYGHAAQGFNEAPDHPGNVYWHQALKANGLFKMLDGKQRAQALIPKSPPEARVGFRPKGEPIPGIAVSELSNDQKAHCQEILKTLLEPYRAGDREEAHKCLTTLGGLDACHLSFYEAEDLGKDGVWDNWRLEGPGLVWHFRGAPHVHVWVNIADDPSLPINSRG